MSDYRYFLFLLFPYKWFEYKYCIRKVLELYVGMRKVWYSPGSIPGICKFLRRWQVSVMSSWLLYYA